MADTKPASEHPGFYYFTEWVEENGIIPEDRDNAWLVWVDGYEFAMKAIQKQAAGKPAPVLNVRKTPPENK